MKNQFAVFSLGVSHSHTYAHTHILPLSFSIATTLNLQLNVNTEKQQCASTKVLLSRFFVHSLTYGIAKRRIYIPALLFVVVIYLLLIIICCICSSIRSQSIFSSFILNCFFFFFTLSTNFRFAWKLFQEICLLIFPQFVAKNILICCNFRTQANTSSE